MSTFVDDRREEFILDHDQTPLVFECGPFTRLIKDMRSLWASVYQNTNDSIRAARFDYEDDGRVLEMKNHDDCIDLARRMIDLCTDVLREDGWLEDDAARHRTHRQSLNLPPTELDPCVGDTQDLDGATYGHLDYFVLPPSSDTEDPWPTDVHISTEPRVLKRRNSDDLEPEMGTLQTGPKKQKTAMRDGHEDEKSSVMSDSENEGDREPTVVG